MDRRDFLKSAGAGVSALVVGRAIPGLMENPAYAAVSVQSLRFRITDAMKEMVTHNSINEATCYFWIYKEERFPADCPGPIIFCTEGDSIQVTLTNDLDEAHSFFIPGVIDTGPIAPNETKTVEFEVPRAGTYLYYDNLNAPVNRVMGLHGAFIAMPKGTSGRVPTPYAAATPAVQALFDDLGRTRQFPGLAWHQGDPASSTPAFRQHVWLLHEASPLLFAEVGAFPAGQDFPADVFLQRFNRDPYANTYRSERFNRKPHFFTINGQSGYFVHDSSFITPSYRVGEPTVMRILNAGLWVHSLHAHANHFFVTAMDNEVQTNIPYVDTMPVAPEGTSDWLYPFVRPPDIPNVGGIGLPDSPLIGLNGNPVWPPLEELNLVFRPDEVDAEIQLSPLCYPMHDHIETSQTAQGANYPLGMVAGFNFTGDRTLADGIVNFPNSPKPASLNRTGPAAPPMHHTEH